MISTFLNLVSLSRIQSGVFSLACANKMSTSKHCNSSSTNARTSSRFAHLAYAKRLFWKSFWSPNYLSIPDWSILAPFRVFCFKKTKDH